MWLCQRRGVELRNESIADEHRGFLAAVLGALADYLGKSLQSLLEVLHALRVAAVLLALSLIPGIDRGGQFLGGIVRYKVVLKEQCHLVTVVLISVSGLLH